MSQWYEHYINSWERRENPRSFDEICRSVPPIGEIEVTPLDLEMAEFRMVGLSPPGIIKDDFDRSALVYEGKDSNGNPFEVYVTHDSQTVILHNIDGISRVESGTKHGQKLAKLQSYDTDDMAEQFQIAPNLASASGSVLGGITLGVYSFNSIAQFFHAKDIFIYSLSAILTIPEVAVGAGVGMGLGWIVGKVVEFAGANYYDFIKPVTIIGEENKQVHQLFNSDKNIIPKAPTVVWAFDMAVASMLIVDANSREFWDIHAQPAIDKVMEYEQKIKLLEGNGASEEVSSDVDKSDEDDIYVLRYKAQSVVHALIQTHKKRQHIKKKEK